MESSPNVINPNWDFAQMGIGGLNKEFSDIFRRAFASRLFPQNIIADLGIKHAKGYYFTDILYFQTSELYITALVDAAVLVNWYIITIQF